MDVADQAQDKGKPWGSVSGDLQTFRYIQLVWKCIMEIGRVLLIPSYSKPVFLFALLIPKFSPPLSLSVHLIYMASHFTQSDSGHCRITSYKFCFLCPRNASQVLCQGLEVSCFLELPINQYKCNKKKKTNSAVFLPITVHIKLFCHAVPNCIVLALGLLDSASIVPPFTMAERRPAHTFVQNNSLSQQY